MLIFKQWKAIRLMVEAWDLAARGLDEEAEIVFKQGECIFLELKKNLPIEYQIKKGWIKFNVSKHQECLNVFKNIYYSVLFLEQVLPVCSRLLGSADWL